MPSKEERLKAPEKNDLNKALDALEADVKLLAKKKDNLIKKKITQREGGVMKGKNTTYRDALNNLIKEQKDITREKRAV